MTPADAPKECPACAGVSHRCECFFCGCWEAESSSYDANIHHTKKNGGRTKCRCQDCGDPMGRHHARLAEAEALIRDHVTIGLGSKVWRTRAEAFLSKPPETRDEKGSS